MTIWFFSTVLFFGSVGAGIIGALTGLGGGVVIIPLLVLVFHINIHYAMGASLISVIATSSGAASAYLREGYTNLRIGMFLEVAAVIGAVLGASILIWIPKILLMIIFSGILFFSAYLSIIRKEDVEHFLLSHPWALKLKLNGTYHKVGEVTNIPYQVQNVPSALAIMGLAGIISGLLGIGSGALKVLAMDHALRLPYKVATTTSNFMIGITAATSAGIYFANGFIHPLLTFPVLLGVTTGAFLGAKLLVHIHQNYLRIIFSCVICLVGIQMLIKALMGI